MHVKRPERQRRDRRRQLKELRRHKNDSLPRVSEEQYRAALANRDCTTCGRHLRRIFPGGKRCGECRAHYCSDCVGFLRDAAPSDFSTPDEDLWPWDGGYRCLACGHRWDTQGQWPNDSGHW